MELLKTTHLKRSIIIALLIILPNLIRAQVTEISTIEPDHPYIEYIGRVDKTDTKKPRFGFSGVALRFKFSGEVLKVMFSSTSEKNHYFFIIDEEKPIKINLKSHLSIYALAEALKDTIHEAQIIRLTEGSQGIDTFHGLILGANDSLVRLPQAKKRMFEFYGNSITCGFGNETDDPGDRFDPSQENFYYTYASYVSRIFEADCIGISKSGIGMYRNHRGSATGSSDNMLTVYDHILFKDNNLLWDFTGYIPEIVGINLGTNDARDQDLFRSEIFEDSCKVLVQTLRMYYPDAHIIYITGPTQKGEKLASVQNAVKNVIEDLNDPKFTLFNMSSQTGEFGIGGTWHPTAAQHYHNAKELARYIESIRQWDPAPYITSAIVDQDGHEVRVSFSESLQPGDSIVGFKLRIDNSVVSGMPATIRENKDSVVILQLNERIKEGNNILIDYNYGNVKSEQGINLQPFFSEGVTNKVKETKLQSAIINSTGDKLILTFNKPIMEVFDANIKVNVNNSNYDQHQSSNLNPLEPDKVTFGLLKKITNSSIVELTLTDNFVCGNDKICSTPITNYPVLNNSTLDDEISASQDFHPGSDRRDIILFPNPAGEFFNLTINSHVWQDLRKLIIHDIAGKQIKTINSSSHNFYDIKDLEKGFYTLNLMFNSGQTNLLLIKQ